MTNPLINIYKVWDSVALKRVSEGHYRILTDPPAWIGKFVPGAKVDTEFEPGALFPYLDNFLFDAEEFWNTREEGRMRSDPWIEPDPGGREWPLEAVAVFSDDTPMLMIQHLGKAYERRLATLQTARDNLLNQEWLELEVQKRTLQIRQREEELIFRLLAAAGFRDEETGAHIKRIGLYAEVMAKELGWDARSCTDIRLAAPMHDIGKIGIPDYILLKAGKLDADELTVMRTHADIGGRMLEGSDISILHMAASIARSHHERWDGSGYPLGTRGEDIPEAARIVALVDVYDAMVHARVYKPAIPEDEVLAFLRSESAKHFDPAMVELFLSLLPQMRKIRSAIQDETPDWALVEAKQFSSVDENPDPT